LGRRAEGTTHESTMFLAARLYLRGINTSGVVKAAFFKGTGFLLRLQPSGPTAPCRTVIVGKIPGFRSATNYGKDIFRWCA
jgi:hypothetical protein